MTPTGTTRTRARESTSTSANRQTRARRRWRPPSPALIVACVALILALGGVSYAAAVLPKNSVGTAQLKKKAVSAAKLKKNAVTGAKVKHGSLLAADFKAGQLPAGPAGPQGPKGETGAVGPQGAKGAPGTARAYATVGMSFGKPNLLVQRSHNAVAVRRVPGDPVGHFCVEVLGIPKFQPTPGYQQLATAPVAGIFDGGQLSGGATAGLGYDGGDCASDEIEVSTFVTPGTPADKHFTLVVP
jgi:hypothetical protein